MAWVEASHTVFIPTVLRANKWFLSDYMVPVPIGTAKNRPVLLTGQYKAGNAGRTINLIMNMNKHSFVSVN